MPLSFSTGGSKALGFTGSTAVLASSAVYSFVVSPFGANSVYNPMVAVPPVLLETSNNLNAQTFVFYVHGAGAGVRPLFWRIKHITTTAADFGEVSGTFASNNWGTSAYNPGYSWYNNPYGEELGRFGIYTIAENVSEGTETFQVEIREASLSGPVVLTSPVISLADTSAPATFTFDTDWNDAISQGGLTEGNTYEFRVKGTNLSTGEEYPPLAPYPEGWRTYYTIDGKPLNYNYPDSQYYTWAYDYNEGNIYAQQLLPAMHIYVKNAEYLDNVPRPGYGSPTNTTRKETFGSGKFYISPRNDGVTEGPTTHTIQLRTSPMNADYTGGATIATYTFTIKDALPITNTFEYQIIGGGGSAGDSSGANYSAGGGGAGGFVSSSVIWGDRNNDSLTWQISVGAGGTPYENAGHSSISSQIFTFTAWGGGRGAGTNVAAQSGGSGGGGSAGGGGDIYNVGGAGTSGQGYSGGKAWQFGYSNIGGGGGGATGPGTYGGSGYSGNGGPGTTDWFNNSVSYGGGGKSAANISGASGSPSGAGPANSGAGGGGITGATSGMNGGSGKVIIRYSESYRVPFSVTGNPTVTVTGGYRYYTWTTSGSIKFAN
jgi:hypothetical protein